MRKWGDSEGILNTQQLIDGEGNYWFRHPDGDTVFRVVVEELPRDQWPDVLGAS